MKRARRPRAWLCTALLLPVLAAAACSSGQHANPPQSGYPEALGALSRDDRLARGEELYADHCAVCHGKGGRADGPGSLLLFPPARDFSSGRFRLVSSTNGAPLDRDLVWTLRRGMPGSAMPAWNWLGEEELWSLAAYVRQLSVQGMATTLADESGLSTEEARRTAERRMTPGESLDTGVPPVVAASAQGALLYRDNCAACHGPDGSGEPEPRWNEDDTINWARDFTAGIMKGGASPQEIAYRIRAGIPGSAMPPTDLGAEETRALVAHVRSMIPAGSEARLVHRRETLHARRIGEVPVQPEDERWNGADEVDFVLAPLWWTESSVLSVRVAALHDGVTLAVRMRWPDATGDMRLYSDSQGSDAAALQFSEAERPVLFGMGSPDNPTTVWHWQALRLEEIAGAMDLLEADPHLDLDTRPGQVRVDAPVYHRMLAVPATSETVEDWEARGVDRAGGTEHGDAEVEAEVMWETGEWTVVFHRPLSPADKRGLVFRPGTSLQLACAVWNGAAGDGGPRKSISTWQELTIVP